MVYDGLRCQTRLAMQFNTRVGASVEAFTNIDNPRFGEITMEFSATIITLTPPLSQLPKWSHEEILTSW